VRHWGWGWRPEGRRGAWRFAPYWLKPAAMAVPWLSAGLLLLMLHMIGGTMTSAEGVAFDLPVSALADGEPTPLVALVMPMPNAGETYVFFDDARYSLGNDMSVAALGEHLAERSLKSGNSTLLVLADRGVDCSQLVSLASIVRRSGIERMLFANRNPEVRAE